MMIQTLTLHFQLSSSSHAKSCFGQILKEGVLIDSFYLKYQKTALMQRNFDSSDVTKDYLLEETTHEKYGDFSNCTAESHMNDWNNVILSGNITKMSLKIGRQEGDVESTLSARYQFVKKRKFVALY